MLMRSAYLHYFICCRGHTFQVLREEDDTLRRPRDPIPEEVLLRNRKNYSMFTTITITRFFESTTAILGCGNLPSKLTDFRVFSRGVILGRGLTNRIQSLRGAR